MPGLDYWASHLDGVFTPRGMGHHGVSVGDIDGDGFGKVYEYFLGKFAMAEGAKGGQFFTPTSIVRLIVEIMTGMTSTTTATTIPGLGQTYYNNAVGALTGEAAARAYLTKVYEDVFRLSPTASRLQFSWLPAATP